ncbi:MAG: hypothetical protein KC486_28180 [Myxococcales bacterium]|nr:hypothetical protein [Myxococcales bacterium]
MRSTPRTRSLGLRSAALALSILVPAATVPTAAAASSPIFAMAKKKKKKKAAKKEPENKLTAEQAEEARAAVKVRGMGLVDDDPGAAASLYAEEARKLGDPVLFIEAAEAYKAQGAKEREIEPVQSGMEEARIALDILYFLQDPRADANWEIVAESEISGLIDRAKGHLDASETLIEEIEAEKAPPPPPEAEGKQRTPAPKDGRGFIAAGSLLTAVGVGGLGMMGAGIAMGIDAQNQVEDPTVTGQDFDDADAKGKKANIISYAGIGVGAVGIIGGVALLVIGVKKRKAYKADHDDSAKVRVTPALGPAMTGLSISGRF